MTEQQRRCENCIWWQDYDDRVFAFISTGNSSFARNRVELRRCRFTPHPSSGETNDYYTDADYCCGEFAKKDSQ